MKKPKTQLGMQVATLLSKQGDDYALIASAKEYDNFQVTIDDQQAINIVCHAYPELAHGILIHTRSIYPLSEKAAIPELIRAVNDANLKSTSVITAIEVSSDEQAFTIHFKSFIHFAPGMEISPSFDDAMKLHMQEIKGVILPYFENINEEVGSMKITSDVREAIKRYNHKLDVDISSAQAAIKSLFIQYGIDCPEDLVDWIVNEAFKEILSHDDDIGLDEKIMSITKAFGSARHEDAELIQGQIRQMKKYYEEFQLMPNMDVYRNQELSFQEWRNSQAGVYIGDFKLFSVRRG